ncbi:unnamed protein product [Sphacelaria rigidula]
MEGQLSRGVWETVDRPKGKTVLGTRLVFSEKYKCRFVSQGFCQIPGIHYQESSSPIPAQSSIRMTLALMATQKWEERQLDVDMATSRRISRKISILNYPTDTVRPRIEWDDSTRLFTAWCTLDYCGRRRLAKKCSARVSRDRKPASTSTTRSEKAA